MMMDFPESKTPTEIKDKLEHFGMDYYKRQSGRTTRMMEAAKAAAQSGQAVTVLMKDKRSADDWIARGWSVPGMEITWMNMRENYVNWNTMKLTDHRANNVLFIDHDVYYGQFKDVFREFSKYDLPVKDVPQHVLDVVFPKDTPDELTLRKVVNDAVNLFLDSDGSNFTMQQRNIIRTKIVDAQMRLYRERRNEALLHVS